MTACNSPKWRACWQGSVWITGTMYYTHFTEKDDFLVSDTDGSEKNLSTLNRSQTYDPSGYYTRCSNTELQETCGS